MGDLHILIQYNDYDNPDRYAEQITVEGYHFSNKKKISRSVPKSFRKVKS